MALAVTTMVSAKRPFGTTEPKVFYGGVRAGDLGGTLVKIANLNKCFPQHIVGYNTVYLLSNAPYLSARSLDRLKRRGVTCLHNQNGVFYAGWFAGDWEGENRRMAVSYHRADFVFWQSEFCRRCADRFLGKRAGPGAILFNATDIDRYSPRSKPLPQAPFRFLTTGKFTAHLVYRLVSAIQSLAYCVDRGHDFELQVAGWVDETALVEAQQVADAAGVADRVHFSGAYSQSSAPDIYRSCHAYVMTKYMDPCPNTVIEALACGLPVAYSASGGVPELVGPDAGVGVDVPEDFAAIHMPATDRFAEAMIALSKNHLPMAQAARSRAETAFNLTNWIERHADIMRSHLEARN
ncbi:MAG: glycosyltransferase family 4 protein [Alphaproteobacteria bacterium]|nr:glycosyltransferase family 4 protein [Alphaproteobacteria bacterium]